MAWNWMWYVTKPVAAVVAAAAAADAANRTILPGLPLVQVSSRSWIVL